MQAINSGALARRIAEKMPKRAVSADGSLSHALSEVVTLSKEQMLQMFNKMAGEVRYSVFADSRCSWQILCNKANRVSVMCL
eukprot:2153254-Rhodomonas_salina.1